MRPRTKGPVSPSCSRPVNTTTTTDPWVRYPSGSPLYRLSFRFSESARMGSSGQGGRKRPRPGQLLIGHRTIGTHLPTGLTKRNAPLPLPHSGLSSGWGLTDVSTEAWPRSTSLKGVAHPFRSPDRHEVIRSGAGFPLTGKPIPGAFQPLGSQSLWSGKNRVDGKPSMPSSTYEVAASSARSERQGGSAAGRRSRIL